MHTLATRSLELLDARRSVPSKQLQAPGPDDAQLMRMLQSAVRVPDHGKRVPFRFLRIAGDARHALGELLVVRARERDANVSDAALDKDRHRFAHAPMVIAVIAAQDEDEKIPRQERLLSAGCVCFALLQATQACGFGAQWLTGWPAYDGKIRASLGVGAHEVVAGFIHIGTPKMLVPERDRPDPRALLSNWQA